MARSFIMYNAIFVGAKGITTIPVNVYLSLEASSSVDLTVSLLIVRLRQLMARSSTGPAIRGNKNAMEAFIGYHWPTTAGCIRSRSQKRSIVPFVKYPWNRRRNWINERARTQ